MKKKWNVGRTLNSESRTDSHSRIFEFWGLILKNLESCEIWAALVFNS